MCLPPHDLIIIIITLSPLYRIVFHTATKRDGVNGTTWNDPSSIKQIAGRAGRLSSNYKIGEVTAWQVMKDERFRCSAVTYLIRYDRTS